MPNHCDYIMECSIFFDLEHGSIEDNAHIIASAVAAAGYAIDLDDYENVSDNKYVLFVSIPFDIWDYSEDPEDVADSLIRDIINESGVDIVLDNLVEYKENNNER